MAAIGAPNGVAGLPAIDVSGSSQLRAGFTRLNRTSPSGRKWAWKLGTHRGKAFGSGHRLRSRKTARHPWLDGQDDAS